MNNIKEWDWNVIILFVVAIICFIIVSSIISHIFYEHNIMRTDYLHTINQHCIFGDCFYADSGTFMDFSASILIVLAPMFVTVLIFQGSLLIFERGRGW